MLSFDTEPATGSEYSLTRLRLGANASEEAPMVVLPNVPDGRCTTAVWAELAGVEGPAEFDAVTATRSVLPASADATTYVEDVAVEIGAQFAPLESQRCHWYA